MGRIGSGCIMRHTLSTVFAALALSAATTAWPQKAPPPPKLEPLPEPPPPPPEIAADPELQPQVTIVYRENETIEEFRVNGRLTMVKVTPHHGRPYYLVAGGPDGGFVRRDSLDSGLKVPLWVLFEF
jgi:hypothetical protein